jgi:hypothetical protein
MQPKKHWKSNGEIIGMLCRFFLYLVLLLAQQNAKEDV